MTYEGNLVPLNPPLTASPPRNWQILVGGYAIALCWLGFNGSALQWIGQSVHEISPFNGLLLLAASVLLMGLGVRYQRSLQFSLMPKVDGQAIGLLLGSAVASIACQWLIDLEQLPVLFFILGTYGLLGNHLPAPIWRKGLVVAVAIACIVPFGVQFSTGLGFPARVLTAHAVEHILATWNIAALSSEDIIVLDTGIAHVDLPCSGLKSLWTGTLFLLAATWLEGRQLGLRWLGVAVIHLGLLVIANFSRILTLVILAHVLNQPQLAAMLHVPLGLISFITVCGLSWGLLRWVPRDRRTLKDLHPDHRQGSLKGGSPILVQRMVVITLVGLLLLARPADRLTTSLDWMGPQWSTPLNAEPVALTPIEQAFFADYTGVVAEKQRFQFGKLAGEMLVVTSPTWQAHHAPELCLVSSGFQVDHMQQQSIAPDLLTRWLSLNHGSRSAVYWFQSSQGTTDDFLTRIWSEVSRQQSDWALVSILFDSAQTPTESEVQTFLNTVHHDIRQTFNSSRESKLS